jgi:hypothetical protein
LEFNEKHTIDLIDYKSLFNENAKTVIMMTYDLYGGQKAAELKIQTVSIAIKKTQNNILAAKENTYPYVFNISGATSKISEKGVIYNFYTENDLTNPVYNIKSSLDTMK